MGRLWTSRLVAGVLTGALVASCGTLTGLDEYGITASSTSDASADGAALDAPSPTSDGAAPGPGDASPAPDVATSAPDATPFDAAMDANVPCPAVCNGGCAGGICAIQCPGCPSPLVCPPGLPCRVTCTGTVCPGTIDCGGATACSITCQGQNSCRDKNFLCRNAPCSVKCVGTGACDTAKIDAKQANGLCFHCETAGACDDLTCEVPTSCNRACVGTNACTEIAAACAGCGSVAACPF